MHVAGVIAAGMQPHRPAAVETRTAAVTAAQGILPLTNVIPIARDQCREALEEGLDEGVLAAREILRGLGTLAQRLIEERMPVRIVQGAQLRGQFCQKAFETG